MIAHAAQWLNGQMAWVITATLVVIGVIALAQRRIMVLITAVIVGGILDIFAIGGPSVMASLANMFKSALGL